MTNDANTEWFKHGPDIAKAKELFKKSGYDGRPVVVLQATDHYLANPAGLFMAQWLRQAGVNVDLAASDWGAVLTRRAVEEAAGRGRLEHLLDHGDRRWRSPTRSHFSGHAANGDKAWFGWPTNDRQEKLRDEWADAPSARRPEGASPASCRRTPGTTSTHVYLGQFFRGSAWRKNVTGVIGMPEIVPFWNMEKTAWRRGEARAG